MTSSGRAYVDLGKLRADAVVRIADALKGSPDRGGNPAPFTRRWETVMDGKHAGPPQDKPWTPPAQPSSPDGSRPSQPSTHRAE
ncbi:hypothetical protein J7E97_27825 [Streptomyces sp. ISL-66]|uniref:hypothetical protein n=1 Tax=Streptomyces sp. ISL-66 TaxID=2819186 RepID=UPI001BE5864B|nr:hypothetical protein [Streptomyces sp. ISL-66]MBT2471569.1 hypothetical protein [Streptomyces sp. ISL-66]